MKLQQFEHCNGYLFKLIFENGEIRETNLEPLIGHHVSLENIQTAHIDSEWGCLEFNAGMVDIDPKTLYHFSSVRSLGLLDGQLQIPDNFNEFYNNEINALFSG